MKIKQSLLEYLIRECIHEVINQVNESERFWKQYGSGVSLYFDGSKELGRILKKGNGWIARTHNGENIFRNEEEARKYIEDLDNVKNPYYRAGGGPLEEADDETVGAATPPEAGQGVGENPEIPKAKDTTPPEPEDPNEPKTPLLFIDPRNKIKPIKVPFTTGMSRPNLERAIQKAGRSILGSAEASRLQTGATTVTTAMEYLNTNR